jgi:YgiT-type zinc finger domain-containing protein
MKCSIQGCTGIYEERRILHTVRYQGQVVVIDNVPADVCSICGDTLLKPETIRSIERILRERSTPTATAPLFEFA